jgi:hypothetical protein
MIIKRSLIRKLSSEKGSIPKSIVKKRSNLKTILRERAPIHTLSSKTHYCRFCVQYVLADKLMSEGLLGVEFFCTSTRETATQKPNSLRVLRIEVSVYNVYITNQFPTTFAQGGRGEGGVKSAS